jgi:hypothetical protein
MRNASLVFRTLAFRAFAGVALLASPAIAELSVSSPGNNVFFQAEPGQIWTKFRQGVPSERILNPFGDARGDGAPSIGTNPASGLPEVAWGRAGTWPAVMFASWDPELEQWNVRDFPRATGTSAWAGRVVQLLYDDHGNRLVVFDDPVTGRILLGSAPPYSQHLNRPIKLNVSGYAGAGPSALWDGSRLVVAYGRLDSEGAIEIVEVELQRDDEGWIPNGGEGVPGIPDPVFRHGGGPLVPGGPGLPGARIPVASGTVGTVEVPPPLVKVEALDASRLLVTWVNGTLLDYVTRTDGTWSDVSSVDLPDPVDHENVREDLRRSLAPGRGRR